MTATTGVLLAQYLKHGRVTVPGKQIPDPHNRLEAGVCGCGTVVGSLAGWAEHRHELTASGAAVQAHLRERNRLYGKASETIGRLRAENARLRMERAEWRGTVNGDVLVEVLAASAPEGWTPEDRRRHAEQVLEAMQASGIEVRRAARFARKSFDEPVVVSVVDGGRR